jgi:hypothetical protein
MVDRLNAPELLGVEVDQVVRMGMFIALHRHHRIEVGQAGQIGRVSTRFLVAFGTYR